jgi:hypothetical protein
MARQRIDPSASLIQAYRSAIPLTSSVGAVLKFIIQKKKLNEEPGRVNE